MSAPKQPPAQVGNVVAMPKRLSRVDALLADRAAEKRRQNQEIHRLLLEIKDLVDVRHQDRVNALVPMGMSMDAQTLTDFIEIGQRLLNKGAGA